MYQCRISLETIKSNVPGPRDLGDSVNVMLEGETGCAAVSIFICFRCIDQFDRGECLKTEWIVQ